MAIPIHNRPVETFTKKKCGRPIGSSVFPFRQCNDVGDSFFAAGKTLKWGSMVCSRWNKILAPWKFKYKEYTTENGRIVVRGILVQRVE